jgi:hypothetical protein
MRLGRCENYGPWLRRLTLGEIFFGKMTSINGWREYNISFELKIGCPSHFWELQMIQICTHTQMKTCMWKKNADHDQLWYRYVQR